MRKQDYVKMHSYPSMVAVVGVMAEDGPTFMAAGWHAYISMAPPMYGVAIGRQRFTYDKVVHTGRFTINFLPFKETAFIQ